MKKKKLQNLFLISLFFLFNGCNNSKPTSQDFIGTWVSEDGGEIIFKEDSICIVKGIYAKQINPFSEEKVSLSGEGQWRIRTKDSNGYDKYNIAIYLKGVIYFSLFISGEGLLDNKPPWYLFDYIGDPDELNLYKFTKSK